MKEKLIGTKNGRCTIDEIQVLMIKTMMLAGKSDFEIYKNEVEKVLNTPQAHESIKPTLFTRKTLQRLVEIAGNSGGDKANKNEMKEGEK